MFLNASMFDTLESIAEYEDQFLDSAEIGIALEAFRAFCDPKDLE